MVKLLNAGFGMDTDLCRLKNQLSRPAQEKVAIETEITVIEMAFYTK